MVSRIMDTTATEFAHHYFLAGMLAAMVPRLFFRRWFIWVLAFVICCKFYFPGSWIHNEVCRSSLQEQGYLVVINPMHELREQSEGDLFNESLNYAMVELKKRTTQIFKTVGEMFESNGLELSE